MPVTLDYIQRRRAIYNFVRGVLKTRSTINTTTLAKLFPLTLFAESAWHDRVTWANNTLRALERNGELRAVVKTKNKRRVRCYRVLDTQKAEATLG